MHGMNDSRSFMGRFLTQLDNGSKFIDKVMWPQGKLELHDDAQEEYQKLGKQAQDQLHISPIDQVPIKSMKNLPRKGAGGMAKPSAIFIDEDCFNKHSIIIKKYALLHEAAHVKHRHNLQGHLIMGATFGNFCACLFIMFKSNLFTKNELTVSQAVALAATVGSTYWMIQHMQGFESQADQTAIHALNCHKCVDEVKEAVRGNASRLVRGYWGAEKMQPVIDKFKQETKLCLYHK
jgi:hypothetical protein